jgi:hypothetical protein
MYYDMSDCNDTDKSGNESIGSTIKEAKLHMDSLPYWGEAIQKGGLSRTICDSDGMPVCQRDYTVTGVGYNKSVVASAWYDC